MSSCIKRQSNFLNNYDFFRNSIDFRIESSNALQKWKTVQQFQLNQLVNGRFFFEQNQREILLLSYDLWSKWLYEIENFCIEISGKKESKEKFINKKEIDCVVKLANKVSIVFDNITSKHEQYFDTKFTEIWHQQRSMVKSYIINEIKLLQNSEITYFFKTIVDILIETQQHSLIEIHEIENLFLREKDDSILPFVVITAFNSTVFEKTGTCLVSERVKFYKEKFGITDVYVKNYTADPISALAADYIESIGIKINYKLSSRFSEDSNPSSHSTF